MGFIDNAVGRQQQTAPTFGCSATFTLVPTVNTTGTAALAAGGGRQFGAWVYNDTAGIGVLVGDGINNAAIRIATPGPSSSPQPFFVPGAGAIYVKTLSGIANVVVMSY